MVSSEKEISERNQEAHLVSIQSKIDEKTVELTGILKQRDEALADRDAVANERVAFEKEKKDFAEDKQIKNGEFLKQEDAHRTELATLAKQLVSVKDELKSSTKELTKINLACINAKSDLDSLTKDKEALERQINYLTDLVVNYELTKEKYTALSEEVRLLDGKMTAFHETVGRETREHREVLAQINNEAQVKILERDLAANELKSYTDQLYTAMNDYQVIKVRLEDKWKTTFPDLEIPLAI